MNEAKIDGDLTYKLVKEWPDFRLFKCCYRGYSPFYRLHKKIKFLCFSWWSITSWKVEPEKDLDKIEQYVKNYYKWPDVL